jgi:glycosidase
MRGSRGGENTDANRRLAMLWGDDDIIRDPVGSTYPADKQIGTTVADQIEDENSMYSYYCKLIAIRHKYPAIARGDYAALNFGMKNLGGFRIDYEGETLYLIHNTTSVEMSIDLSELVGAEGGENPVLADFIGAGEARLEGTTLIVGGYTSVVLW